MDCHKLKEGNFPRNFGVDTLAGVMGVDPPSFGGKERGRGRGSGGSRGLAADEQERKMVMDFLERWKKFDWTSELDGEMIQACVMLDCLICEMFQWMFPKLKLLGCTVFHGGSG